MTRGRGWASYLLVLAGAATGLVTIAMGLPAWAGSLVVAGSVLLGAVLRLVVPGESLLAVRRRRTDAVTLGVLGCLLAGVAVSLALQWMAGR
ncbi:hypothetical protein Sme01_42610 [Sphaerisporangium melleum]|uniref:DUF3017 domain-containing protein n=1 Tax=Sphaerisporangium melleum TaxID=321316 RepID=A0A917QYM6_9ACTN|nr:DUF3017 domain-containing protein [Sphaerisporangium melleum]GGK76895.1 hypothetical protein GCM10007964_19570 [Sphaerisporangium melleum]GII71785.1 hypothetical protein Sme01_42610 [Sphaerisporangium melleum]